MQFRTALLGSAALALVVATSFAGEAGATTKHKHHANGAAPAGASAAEVKALSEEVETLEGRLSAEGQAREAMQAQVQAAQAQAAQAQADAQAARSQLAEQIQTIPGVVKADIAADKPKDGKAHYKGVTLTVGGFAAAESVYRSKQEEADIGSNYSKIPFANVSSGHTSEERFTARQSRLSLLAEGDINPDTKAAFYTELDFLAGPQTANSNESNSFSPRIRNVYGTLDMGNVEILAGQNWSLTTLNSKGITPRNEVSPATIEAQYVTGFVWTRQPQLRVTTNFADKQVWAAVSLENPQTTIGSAATGTTGTTVTNVTALTGAASFSQFDSANTLSFNHVPDVVGKVAFEPNIGGSRPIHAEAFGLYRSYYDRVTVSGANTLGLPTGVSNKNTDGGGFGGSVTWTVVPKLLDVQISGITGRGIGRYGAGSLPDTIVGVDGSLKPIPETMYLAGATLHATSALDLYVYYGDEQEKAVATTIGANHYGFGSPFANLTNCSVEGASCTADIKTQTQITGGLWDKVYTGSFGQVRVGLQYSSTTLTAFAGSTGGAPKTTDNMVFTSFRYYPF